MNIGIVDGFWYATNHSIFTDPMLSFYNNKEIKHSVLLQLEDQLIKRELQPIQLDQRAIEIYASPGRPAIDYSVCADVLGLPESLLRLMMIESDWASYTDYKEAIHDTIKDRLVFFKSIPIGNDLTYIAHIYLQWVLTEQSFGAARFADQLGELLPKAVTCIETSVFDEKLLEEISKFNDVAEEKYRLLYDNDTSSACRWSRTAQVARLLQNCLYFLNNNACISQDEIAHLLCMGLGLPDDPSYFETTKIMEEKLFSVLKSFS